MCVNGIKCHLTISQNVFCSIVPSMGVLQGLLFMRHGVDALGKFWGGVCMEQWRESVAPAVADCPIYCCTTTALLL